MENDKLNRTIRRTIELAETSGRILIATASIRGVPHLAAGAKMSAESGGKIHLRYWFCPGTISNIAENHWMSVVVWDPEADTGFQLTGAVVEVQESAVVDGYGPVDEMQSVPQVERELTLAVDQVLEFRQAPHTDVGV